jgi:hypothetical protein
VVVSRRMCDHLQVEAGETWIDISAGRRVGKAGRRVVGSLVISEAVKVRPACGQSMRSVYAKESRKRLCIVVLGCLVHEKRWSP